MDISNLESNIEFLSEEVHNAWWEEKKDKDSTVLKNARTR